MMTEKVFNPKVSVVTVCLNCAAHIENMVQSVLAQTYQNIELLIIDGGSTDGTLQILEKYRSKIALVLSEPDRGIYDAQNKGLRLAKGEITCLLNSDDRFFDHDTVRKVVDFFSRHESADFIYGNVFCLNPKKEEAYVKIYPDRLKKRFFLRGPLGHQATFYRRDCFERVGFYNTSYKISGDYDWFLRALFRNQLKAMHLNEFLVVFQECGRSSNDELRIKETKKVLSEHFTPQEARIGSSINFFLHGDFLRFLGGLTLGSKGYKFMRTFGRKTNYSRYLKTQVTKNF